MKIPATCALVLSVLPVVGGCRHDDGSGSSSPGYSISSSDTNSSSSSRSDSDRGHTGGGGNSPSRDGGGVSSGAVPWSSPRSGK